MPVQSQYPLPENRAPVGTRCIQIDIPDDDEYERLLVSSINALAWWFSYDRDVTHAGKAIAALWKKAIKSMRNCDGTPLAKHYEEVIDMPAFRQDCDCNLFVECCDGSEKQLAFKSDIPAGGSPGNGAPQPKPGGGQQHYCQTLNANNVMFLPTLVNTGDVIEVVSAEGSWWDGGENSLGFPLWRCPNGDQYVAGNCTGASTRTVTGTDPSVAAAHMSLIVVIGSNILSLNGGPVTVPGGVTNGNAYIQVNDSAIGNNFGSADVCVKVTNNQTEEWCFIQNLALGDGGWGVHTPVTSGITGAWVAGVGWQNGTYANPAGNNYDAVWIEQSLSGTITSIDIEYDLTFAGCDAPGDGQFLLANGGTNLILTFCATAGSGTSLHKVWVGSISNPNLVINIIGQYVVGGPTGGGYVAVKSVKFTGTGANPFGASNC